MRRTTGAGLVPLWSSSAIAGRGRTAHVGSFIRGPARRVKPWVTASEILLDPPARQAERRVELGRILTAALRHVGPAARTAAEVLRHRTQELAGVDLPR